jgi:hypothetical protein
MPQDSFSLEDCGDLKIALKVIQAAREPSLMLDALDVINAKISHLISSSELSKKSPNAPKAEIISLLKGVLYYCKTMQSGNYAESSRVQIQIGATRETRSAELIQKIEAMKIPGVSLAEINDSDAILSPTIEEDEITFIQTFAQDLKNPHYPDLLAKYNQLERAKALFEKRIANPQDDITLRMRKNYNLGLRPYFKENYIKVINEILPVVIQARKEEIDTLLDKIGAFYAQAKNETTDPDIISALNDLHSCLYEPVADFDEIPVVYPAEPFSFKDSPIYSLEQFKEAFEGKDGILKLREKIDKNKRHKIDNTDMELQYHAALEKMNAMFEVIESYGGHCALEQDEAFKKLCDQVAYFCKATFPSSSSPTELANLLELSQRFSNHPVLSRTDFEKQLQGIDPSKIEYFRGAEAEKFLTTKHDNFLHSFELFLDEARQKSTTAPITNQNTDPLMQAIDKEKQELEEAKNKLKEAFESFKKRF